MKWLHGRSALAIGAGLLLLTAHGCGSKKLQALLKPAPPPVASLRVERLPTASADSAAFELTWSGSAPGGRIDHYLFAIDPRSLDATDAAWQMTRETRRAFSFAARASRSGAAPAAAAAPVRHVFALRAVDASGEVSDPVWRALSLTNIPPSVQIVSPIPSPLFNAFVPPNMEVHWSGTDPDGQFTQKPVRYKYKLFKDTDPIFSSPAYGTDQFDLARTNPDSLRRFFAPAFEGWDSVSGDTTSAAYSNLVPNSRYLFVLVGFDEAGDYNPVFSRNTNVLQLVVAFPGTTGPVLTMYNEYFNYTYNTGGYSLDPSRMVNVQVPGGVPLTVNWSAVPLSGAVIHSYRWAMDIADVSDQTPRINEATDWYHWSQPSLLTTSATIGPFQPAGNRRQIHLLYIEAKDNGGLVSLGMVRFMVVPRVFSDENSILIVDDTRLFPDNKVEPPSLAYPDSLAPPIGGWPSAAELDTFLFARGGVRYRMTPNGTLSTPGIFAGYHFDTVSTRFLPDGVIPLALLDQYRHVVWITNANSATGQNSFLGKGALRLMSEIGQANTLAAYLKQGGQLWLAGGWAGSASTLPWNIGTNDRDPPVGVVKFSSTPSAGRPPELQPGRFMYDFVHWRSGFYATVGQFHIVRSTGVAGGWPGAPNYALLPSQLGQKTIANDPLPPFRTATSFLIPTRTFGVEYLSEPNSILEVVDPGTGALGSTLDTLFEAQAVPLPPAAPPPYVAACMTYYHGADNGGLLFSGFDLWSFTRPDLIALADFVLQQVWGLPRDPVARTVYAPAPVAGRPRGQ